MENRVWIKKYDSPKLDSPVAVVGSPGLRSVGKLVVESLIEKTNAQLIAELYSTHLPSVYETKPSYAAHPAFPGGSGIIVTSGLLDMPKVQFYASKNPELIITKGYHANFDGQYIVAEKVVDFISEMHVKRMIVAAGYGSKEKNVCFAATNQSLLEEMKEKFELCTGYKGPFMGFSGLVFGLSKLRQIESICLFAGTQPNQEDLEYPDKDASELVINKLKQILAF
jgi:proteasome assembly chaperone (PAC2) family protein